MLEMVAPIKEGYEVIVEERAVAMLRPHSRNDEIYGPIDADDLLESVRDEGVQMPLLVTFDNRVISGHRRLAAASAVGIASVPVIVSTATDEWDILSLLLSNNIQRQKTTTQLAKEAQAMAEVVRERAKRRQATLNNIGQSLKVTSPEATEAGQTRDIVGAALGVSGKTAERLIEAATGADRLRAAGRSEDAARVESVLNTRGATPGMHEARTALASAGLTIVANRVEAPAPTRVGRVPGNTWYERFTAVARAVETVPPLNATHVRGWSAETRARTLVALRIQAAKLRAWEQLVAGVCPEENG